MRSNINAVGLYAKLATCRLKRDVMLGANGMQLPVVMMEKQG